MKYLQLQCENHKNELGEKPASDLKAAILQFKDVRETQVSQFGEITNLHG